jgi:hypothetical protein
MHYTFARMCVAATRAGLDSAHWIIDYTTDGWQMFDISPGSARSATPLGSFLGRTVQEAYTVLDSMARALEAVAVTR